MTNANNIQKIQNVINIISHLCPEVHQYSTISLPLAHCVNELCDVRDDLKKQEQDTQSDEH